MAQFGAKYPMFSPIDKEEENALPTYKAAPVTIGRLVSANLTVNMASGQLFADDALAESVDEFASGSIAMETDDMVDTVATTVYGATVKDKEVSYKAGDTPPVGGLGYVKVLLRKGVKVYKAVYYPRVKATIGNDNAQTKGDNITFGTNSTTFTVFACNSGEWRITEEFETEAAALEWIKTKLSPAGDG